MTEPIRFFLPGPTYVREAVRQAMTAPSIGHRSEEFKRLYRSLQEPLQGVFRTQGPVLTASASATLVLEAAVRSCASERVLHLTAGAFAERWLAASRANGIEADAVSVPWGQAIEPEMVKAALSRKRYDAVTITHNETSTGVIQPLGELAAVVRESSDALIFVDAVSSLAGAPLENDEWGLDLVLAGTQKAIAAPPGLTVFSLSERATRRAEQIEARGFYTDLLKYSAKHMADGTITTPPIPVVYALQAQLQVIEEEGLAARWQRHSDLAQHTRAWAQQNGYELASSDGAHSLTVSCLRPPEGVEAPALVAALAQRGFVVGSGYGRWKPDTFRIGHMGEVRRRDLDLLFLAVEDSVRELRAAS